jgi:heat shock protein HslJ
MHKLTCWLLSLLIALPLMGVAPAGANPQSGLVGITWQAVEIDGRPVTVPPGQNGPHFVLTSEGNRVHGSAGCNRLAGSFEQGADNVRFLQLVTTKMACPPPLDALEMAFLQALRATTVVRLSGNTLELQDKEGKVRMRLKAAGAE